MDDGLDQGPCGARLHVVLHPNTEGTTSTTLLLLLLLLILLLTHTLTSSLTHPLTTSLTHLLTPSLTHPLTPPPRYARSEELSQFPQAAPLLRASPLHLLATLLLVALPSTELLRLLRPVSLPAPCYPSALIDATNLDDEEWSLDWDHQTSGTIGGAAVGRERCEPY